MTNKMVAIINSLKVPKIKNILLHEISCTKLQLPPEPLTRGLPPPRPQFSLSSTEFVDPHPEQNSLVRHWETEWGQRLKFFHVIYLDTKVTYCLQYTLLIVEGETLPQEMPFAAYRFSSVLPPYFPLRC